MLIITKLISFQKMYINDPRSLVICSGPKDIGRCPIINSIKEEANLKLKSWKVHFDQFNTETMLDVNIVIFALKSMTERDMIEIIKGANQSSMHIFGLNNDKRLHQLIPDAEGYIRWLSVCEFCNSDAAFQFGGNIVCRQCKTRLEIEEKEKELLDGCKRNKRELDLDSSGSSNSSSVQIIETKKANFNDTPPAMTTIIDDSPNTSLGSEIDTNE